MIHHLSIAAENPQHVAQVLAEILQGQPTPHPFSVDSYIVFTFDEYGLCIVNNRKKYHLSMELF